MTAQERYDYLMETEWVPTNTFVTIGLIRDGIGLSPQAYGLVRSTLDKVIGTLKASENPLEQVQGLDLQDALSAMLDRGILLSSADRQAAIDALAVVGSWPDQIRDAVKALGGTRQPRWQIEGYETEPMLAQITTEVTKQQLSDAAADAYQAFREALSAWDGTGDAPTLGGA